MKRILKIDPKNGIVRTSTGPEYEPSTVPSTAVPQRRKLSLSDLTSTAPRTAEEVHRAIAQGRFAELKPEQA